MPQDRRKGYWFACPLSTIDALDLDRADAPTLISHSLGSKRARPAVSEFAAGTARDFDPDIWNRILQRLPVPDPLRFVRSSTYGSAQLYQLPSHTTDHLATWTPSDHHDGEWPAEMDAIAHTLVDDFREDPPWQPTHGGALGALLELRNVAVQARSNEPAEAFYYWYVPLARQ